MTAPPDDGEMQVQALLPPPHQNNSHETYRNNNRVGAHPRRPARKGHEDREGHRRSPKGLKQVSEETEKTDTA